MTPLKMVLLCGSMALLANAATAGQIGVVGLFQNGTSINTNVATKLGCAVQRQGILGAMQGKMSPELTQPSQFVVLACDQSVIGDTDRRASLSAMSADGEPVALFEGTITDFESPATQDIADRQYILKLGYYNNTDVDARNADLAALGEKAAQLDGTWTNESFLQVHTATGIATPDEVVIIYYDSAEIAENFRATNTDILQDVGVFNSTHLTGFSYLIGAATQ